MFIQESKNPSDITLTQFLRSRNQPEKKDITHTKIGDGNANIFPGKFCIPQEDLEKFYELYFNNFDKKGKILTFTEKQNNNVVAIDLDFRYKTEITKRQHTDVMIMDFVKLVANAINDICDIPQGTEIPYYITQREKCVILDDKTKDGLHIVFGAKIDASAQQYIRDYCLKEGRMMNIFEDLPLTNDAENIFDEGVFKKTSNWLLYGSTKPGYEPYKLTDSGNVVYTPDTTYDDMNISIKENDTTMNSLDLIKKMSVQSNNGKVDLPVKSYILAQIENEKSKKQKKPKTIIDNGEYEYGIFIESETQLDEEIEKIGKEFDTGLQNLATITLNLPPKYSDDYYYWIRVGWALFNTDKRLFLTWIKFSSKWDKFNIYDIDVYYELWENFENEEGLTQGTIRMWSRQETPEFYYETYKNGEDIEFNFNDITNASISKLFIEYYGDDFVYNRDNVYHWNGDIWNNECADSVIHRIMQQEMYIKLHQKCLTTQKQEDLPRMLKQLLLLLNRTFREKTYKDIVDKLKMKATKYLFNFTPDQINNIHFKNGVLQLDKIENEENIMGAFRKRVKTDFVNGYNDYDFVEPSKKILEEVKTIYRKIMVDKTDRDYFLTYLGYCLTGNTEQQICEFDIGYNASNGKSAHTEIHNCAMPFYTHKISNQTFNENYSKVHKQFIKLFDKPIRLAILNELKTQKLDANLFKDFVDGEELNVEIMYGTSFNRKHQAKLKVPSNYDPHFEGDCGVLRRGIKLDFESKFADVKEDDWDKKIFIRDRKLLDKFRIFENKNEYCSAYIYMLCPHVMQYLEHKKLYIPQKLRDAFKSSMMDYDTIGSIITSKIVECYDEDKMTPDKRVGKKRLTDIILQEGGKISWRKLLSKMKCLGYVYNSRLSYKYDGKNIKGGFENVIIKEEEEIEDVDC